MLSYFSSNTTLHAVWKALLSGLQTIQYMQDATSALCTATPEKTAITLTDKRDSSTYTVAKLDDGKCWMTQNLRLVNKAITSQDSDVSSNYTVPASSSPWASSDYSRQSVHYANNTTNGAYYSWCAATAGSCSSATTANAVAGSSICPKGWRLPTIAEYTTLKNKGTSSATGGWNIGSGFFPSAGYVYSNSLNNVGSNGYYWSSTASNSSDAYRLYFNSSNVNTG